MYPLLISAVIRLKSCYDGILFSAFMANVSSVETDDNTDLMTYRLQVDFVIRCTYSLRVDKYNQGTF